MCDNQHAKELQEQLEDAEDLKELEELRKQPMEFMSLNDFLKEIEESA